MSFACRLERQETSAGCWRIFGFGFNVLKKNFFEHFFLFRNNFSGWFVFFYFIHFFTFVRSVKFFNLFFFLLFFHLIPEMKSEN